MSHYGYVYYENNKVMGSSCQDSNGRIFTELYATLSTIMRRYPINPDVQYSFEVYRLINVNEADLVTTICDGYATALDD